MKDPGDKNKKQETTVMRIHRPVQTISYTKTIPGEQKKKATSRPITKRKTTSGPVMYKKKISTRSTPPRTTSVHLQTKNPAPLVIKSSMTTPGAPQKKTPDPIVGLAPKERRRVRRVLTTRNGSGIGAKRNQTMRNKLLRTGQKIRRSVSPFMGNTDYYAETKSGKTVPVTKETYKSIKKTLKGVRRPL